MAIPFINQLEELSTHLPKIYLGAFECTVNLNGIVLTKEDSLGTAATVKHLMVLNIEETKALFKLLYALHEER